MSIPEDASKLPNSESLIPEGIPQLPQQEDDPESSPFLISFGKYKAKECGIDNIDKKRALKALRLIKEIGTSLCCENDLKNFKTKSIDDKNNYSVLYNGLHPDAEVKELFIDSDKGRIFFFILKRIFYIISITDAHYNTH